MKRGQYDLVKWTLLIFIYWAMASVAAFMALEQLILKPHYWEKTQHGLHLQAANASRVTTVTEESLRVSILEQLSNTTKVEGDEFDVVTTSRSSSLSLATNEFELEVKEKVVVLKVHTNPKMPAVRPLIPSQDKTVESMPPLHESQKRLPDTPWPEEIEEDTEVTQRLPRISVPGGHKETKKLHLVSEDATTSSDQPNT